MSSDAQRGRKVARDEAAHPGRQLGTEVDDLDRRRGPDRANRQHDPVVDAGPRPADAVDGGRGRPEHDRRARQLAQPDGHVTRLKPRCPVALVGGIVLFVDDDEPDIGQRSDDGQPRPDDDVHLARPDAPPLVGALAVAKARVDERDPRVEVSPQPVDERQGQGDLGDQDEGRPAGLERGRDGLHVDRSLAAAGHPVEQERTRIPGPDRGDDLPDGLRLGGQKIARRGTAAAQSDGSGGQRPARPLADIGVGEPSTDEPRDRRVAVPAGEVRRRLLPGGRDGELPERCDLARSERPPRGGLAVRQRCRGVATRGREADPALIARARAGAAQRPLEADPAGGGHRPQAAQQARPAVGTGQVADGARAALELRQQVRIGRVVRHPRRRTGMGPRRELGDQVEPLEESRRQHRPEDEGRRGEIVAGDPACQPEGQERQERTVGPDPVGDRLGRDRRR